MSDRVYEILFIADPNLGEPEVDTLATQIQGYLEKEGARIQKVEKWGKKRLAYMGRKIWNEAGGPPGAGVCRNSAAARGTARTAVARPAVRPARWALSATARTAMRKTACAPSSGWRSRRSSVAVETHATTTAIQ